MHVPPYNIDHEYEDIDTKAPSPTTTDKPLKRKSYQQLILENEAFIAQYGSYFVTALDPKSSPSTPTPSEPEYDCVYDHEPVVPLQSLALTIHCGKSRKPSGIINAGTLSPINSLKCWTPQRPLADQSMSSMILNPIKSISPWPQTPESEPDHDLIPINTSYLNAKCVSVTECKSIKRIIKALKWYSLSSNDEKIFLSNIMDNQYDTHLLGDIVHLLSQHLNGNLEDEFNDYVQIQKQIPKTVKLCNICECNAFHRYKSNDTSMGSLLNHSSQCNDLQFLMDFMGMIHCYLIHGQFL